MQEDKLSEILLEVFANRLKAVAERVGHLGKVIVAAIPVQTASGRRPGFSVQWISEQGRYLLTLACITSNLIPDKNQILFTVATPSNQPHMHEGISEQLLKWKFIPHDKEWRTSWTFQRTSEELAEMFKSDLDFIVELF